MENIVKFGDVEFTLKENKLGVINAFTPALAKLTALEDKYLEHLDTVEYDALVKNIREIEKAKDQIKDDETRKVDFERYEQKLEEKYTELECFAPLVERIIQFKGFARQEWITDADTLKPCIEKLILKGDRKLINWQSDEIIEFMSNCINFFYSVMQKNNP